MFYQSVMASAVCWGGNTSKKNTGRLDRLVKKVSSVVGWSRDSLGDRGGDKGEEQVPGRPGQCESPPLHHVLAAQIGSRRCGRGGSSQ